MQKLLLFSIVMLLTIGVGFSSCRKGQPSLETSFVKESSHLPQHLAIYYGYPSLVNGATTPAQAVDIFRQFDIIVLGDSLWVPTHPDKIKTTAIISSLKAAKPGIQIFGYIDLGVSGGAWIHNLNAGQITQAADAWKAMGVTGLFADDFGSDFGVSRSRQNYFIDYAHGSGLNVFVNSWFVKDALGGTDCHLTGSDYYLLESFLVSNNNYQSLQTFTSRGDSAKTYQQQGKIKVAVVSTVGAGAATATMGSSDKFTQAWFGTAMYNFDAFQFTDFWHSAADNKLFYYPDAISNYGTQWEDGGVIKESATRCSRRTSSYTFYVEGDGVAAGRGYAVPR